jgi:hypothetical protein
MNEYQTSLMTNLVMIAFKTEPTLEAVADARRLLDSVTDTLILKELNESR